MLVVLDDFIRDTLVQEFSDKLNARNVLVIHHPVTTISSNTKSESRSPSVCFIGYRTTFKGFDDFSRMALEYSSVSFLAIGEGKLENISNRTVEKLRDKNAFIEEISKCSLAMFPYTSGYRCSLSAAALDALSTGVYIVALDQPFFRSLAEYFGPEIVTVYSSIGEFSFELDRKKLLLKQDDRVLRLDKISNSKYGLASVQRSFESLTSNPNS